VELKNHRRVRYRCKSSEERKRWIRWWHEWMGRQRCLLSRRLPSRSICIHCRYIDVYYVIETVLLKVVGSGLGIFDACLGQEFAFLCLFLSSRIGVSCRALAVSDQWMSMDNGASNKSTWKKTE
jgi:hypothetical protein